MTRDLKQFKVGMQDSLRQMLEWAAARSGRSLADEVRQRLIRTLELDDDPPTEGLAAAIMQLAVFVRLQTGHNWHAHAGAHRTFVNALAARMSRLKPPGDPVFGPDELPANRLVAPTSNDPTTIGIAVEAVSFHTGKDLPQF